MDKLRARFSKSPPPTDFKWIDLVCLLESIGFHVENGQGSRRCLVGHFNGVERRINVHEPHPSGIVKRYVIREISQKLLDWHLK